jgi:hypothetical protein
MNTNIISGAASGLSAMLSFIREYSCSFVAEFPEIEHIVRRRTYIGYPV